MSPPSTPGVHRETTRVAAAVAVGAPGRPAAFHRAFVEESVPMLQRWGVEVVAFDPSLDDEDSYYLLRAYPSLEALQRGQDAFYGSDEWREGSREAIVSRMESGSSVVLPASAMLDYTR